MKGKIFYGLTLLVLMTLTLNGAVTAGDSQPALVAEGAGRSTFATPKDTLQQMKDSQARNVTLIGQLGGVANAVVVRSDYAYVGIGPRLVILNITDPTQPTLIGQTAVLPTLVMDVALAGNYAYLTDYSDGLRIIDVSVPNAPIEVGFYKTPSQAWKVDVAGDYAYITTYSTGLRIIDVSQPTGPH